MDVIKGDNTASERKHHLKHFWTLIGAACFAGGRIRGEAADSCTAFIFLGFILKQAATKDVNCNLR